MNIDPAKRLDKILVVDDETGFREIVAKALLRHGFDVLAAANGSGLVVGIHDGGGDRSQTIAALPAIIDGLRSRGYSFVRLCT